MQDTKEHPSDPTRFVQAHRDKLVVAYDKWQRMRGRVRRGSGKTSANEFYEAVQNGLDLSRSEKPSSLKIPRTKGGWANWRAGRSNNLISLRLDVCCSIWMLTEDDVTSNGFLSSAPINPTELVTLGEVEQIVSSGEPGYNEVFVNSISFSASSFHDVFLSDAKTNPDDSDANVRIGSVRFTLREASVSIRAANQIQPLLLHLSDEANKLGSSKGATLSIDQDEEKRWRIQPSFPKEVLQCRLDSLRLCEVPAPGGDVSVAVSVAHGDISPTVRLLENYRLSNAQHETARTKLIEQVLRNRSVDKGIRRRYVLSSAPAVVR